MKFLFKKITFVAFLFLMSSCGDAVDNNNKNTIESPTKTSSKTTSNSPTSTKKKKIIFFGDSLTAGYGLEDPSDSFVGVIQQKIDSLGLDYQTVNAGVSGETTSGGDARIDWVLEQTQLDILILELGGNDGLRGIKPEETLKNLQSIINKTKVKYPKARIVLAGMEAPPNMGSDFTSKFRNVFPTLAKKNNTPLIPFLLDGVGGIPELNQRDGIHPTIAGHRILADNVWRVLKALL